MQYRESFLKLKVKNIVDLFEMNDKSEIVIYNWEMNMELFKGRVDYLQFTSEGSMSELCELDVDALEVNGGELIIYV